MTDKIYGINVNNQFVYFLYHYRPRLVRQNKKQLKSMLLLCYVLLYCVDHIDKFIFFHMKAMHLCF